MNTGAHAQPGGNANTGSKADLGSRSGVGSNADDAELGKFDALASQECGKYGMKAVHIWDSIWDWDRVRVNYNCVP